MKKALTYCLLSGLVMATVSCEKDDASARTQQLCAPTAKAVKTITQAAGIVYLNPTLQQYVIMVHQPGTIDAVDMGVVCGTLPPALQADGTKVLVTGTFREYGQAPPSPTPVGYTYYYLEITEIR